MATLIRNRRIAPDNWRLLKAEDAVPANGDVIVPLVVWNARHEALTARNGKVGVLLENTDDPRALQADFARLGVIAVRFPKFTDGRGYSIARQLRRKGWQGELRAVGDVQRDQLFFMARCGFDAFVLREDQNPDVALTAFADFTVPYQAAVDRGSRFGGPPVQQPAVSAMNPW
jgi:uncharacterized protein (DUF934 family)